MQGVKEIRQKFVELKASEQYVTDKSGCNMLELIGESFVADHDAIFGEPNQDYIDREIQWYISMSRNVSDIPGKVPAIWQQIADKNGMINSNYGWCIWSEENFGQYWKVLDKLKANTDTRQASMIYTRPTMHEDAVENGRSDFMCTHAVNYFVRNNCLYAVVQMRSNDVIFGYRNDYAWQEYVAERLKFELDLKDYEIIWNAATLHVYERHFDMVKL